SVASWPFLRFGYLQRALPGPCSSGPLGERSGVRRPATGAARPRARPRRAGPAGRDGDGGEVEPVAAIDRAAQLAAAPAPVEADLGGEQRRGTDGDLQQPRMGLVDADGGDPPVVAVHGHAVAALELLVQRSVEVLVEQAREQLLGQPHLLDRHRAAICQPQPTDAVDSGAGRDPRSLAGCHPRASASWVNDVSRGAFVRRGSTTIAGPPPPERICCCSRSIARAARTVARATPNSSARRRSEGRTDAGSLPTM